MNNNKLWLGHVTRLTGMRQATLASRVNSKFKGKDIIRGTKDQMLLTPTQIKKLIQDQLGLEKGKIIYIGNLKGGVGKTAIAYLLTQASSMLGLKTCAIDLDVQANLTSQYIEPDIDLPVFFDVIDKKSKIEDVIVKIQDSLDLIPSSLRNGLIQKALTMQPPKNHLTWFNFLCLTYLRNRYDVIIVDTPPNLTTLNSVFCLCLNNNDNLVIPVCADKFSIYGVKMFIEDVSTIRESYEINAAYNPKISIIMNKFHPTHVSHIQLLGDITKEFPNNFCKTIIKESAKTREMITNKVRLENIKTTNNILIDIAGILKEVAIIKTTSLTAGLATNDD